MYLSRKVKERIGAGIGALAFLFIFGGIGATGFWAIGRTVHDGLQAKEWVGVPATISHVDVGQVTYVYEWQGKKYAGDRAGAFILGGSSDVDDWDDRIDAMLTRAMEQKAPVTVFVNPKNPSESMLDREIRWKLLAVFLPFAIGFTAAGLVAGVLIGRKAIGWKESGAGVPLLKPRAREAATQWGVALVWNGVCLPIALVAVPDFWRDGEYFPVAILGVMAFVGLLILWGALHTTVAMLRDGSPFNTRSAA